MLFLVGLHVVVRVLTRQPRVRPGTYCTSTEVETTIVILIITDLLVALQTILVLLVTLQSPSRQPPIRGDPPVAQ